MHQHATNKGCFCATIVVIIMQEAPRDYCTNRITVCACVQLTLKVSSRRTVSLMRLEIRARSGGPRPAASTSMPLGSTNRSASSMLVSMSVPMWAASAAAAFSAFALQSKQAACQAQEEKEEEDEEEEEQEEDEDDEDELHFQPANKAVQETRSAQQQPPFLHAMPGRFS